MVTYVVRSLEGSSAGKIALNKSTGADGNDKALMEQF